jgi:hypothetical protein
MLLTTVFVVLGGLILSVIAIGSKVRGFIPGQERLIFKGDKNLRYAFLRRGSKAVGPLVVRFYIILKKLSKYEMR